jgi:hypothetical protein
MDDKVNADELLEDKEILGLDGVSELLEKEIKILSKKIRTGRIKDPKKEEVRIKMIRTLGYLSKTYAQIKEAQKVEELEKKLEILEKSLKKDD